MIVKFSDYEIITPDLVEKIKKALSASPEYTEAIFSKRGAKEWAESVSGLRALLLALKEEKMDWVQLRDEGFTAGKAFSEYQVMGIPCCLVLDPQGRFYKVNMRGAYLDAFLQELYGR